MHAAIPIAPASAEDMNAKHPIRDQCHNANKHHHNRHHPNVVVFNMRKLMREHPFQFFILEFFQRAGSYGNGGVLWVAASGKSINGAVLDNMHAWHGHAL